MGLNKGRQTCFIFININNFYNHMKKTWVIVMKMTQNGCDLKYQAI